MKHYEVGQRLGGYEVVKDEGINFMKKHYVTVRCIRCGTIYEHREPNVVKLSKHCRKCASEIRKKEHTYIPVPIGTRYETFEVIKDEGIVKHEGNKHSAHYVTVKCIRCGKIYKHKRLRKAKNSIRCRNCKNIDQREKAIMYARRNKVLEYDCQKHGKVFVVNKKGRGNGCMQCEYYTDCLLVFAKKMFVGWRFAEVV